MAVQNAALAWHGALGVTTDPSAHVPAGTTPVVLYPGRGAQPLTPEFVASLPSPPTLIVPDGTWRQARHIVKRLPLLANAAKVFLPTRGFEGEALRRNRYGHRMSTYEAVSQALAILEGEAAAEPLLDFYRRAIDRILLMRGRLKLNDIYGGLDSRAGDDRRSQIGET
jgi:DTW domain-containing protein YfiP